MIYAKLKSQILKKLIWTNKRNIESELKELINFLKTPKGAQIRSRAKWIDEGETNTAFFLKLESSHQNKN